MFKLWFFDDLSDQQTRRNRKDGGKPVTQHVETGAAVTLVGGGDLRAEDLDLALGLAPTLIAADGGANTALRLGRTPARVIGDLDSLDPQARETLGARVLHVPDQDSTDFDKCLARIRAPLILGLGFDGARLDHTLAAMTSLVWHGSARVVLLCAQDVCFLAPPRITLDLAARARVSLFPMAPVTGRSTGLHWPIDGLNFAPQDVIGTSNHAETGQVTLEFDRPGMLVLLERDTLHHVVDRLPRLPDWPRAPGPCTKPRSE
ncbi:MAG: thiamine diphosphokinase [Roseinatronobacter sp.]